MGDIGRNNNIDISEEEIKQAVMMEEEKYPSRKTSIRIFWKK